MRVVKKKIWSDHIRNLTGKIFRDFLPILANLMPLFKHRVGLPWSYREYSITGGRAWGGGEARTSGPKTAGEISYSPGRRLSNPNIYNLPISADRLITKAKNEILPSLALQPRGKPKEQCPVLLTSQVWKHHAKRVVKIPYHAVQPSSEAQHIFCSMW